MRRQIVVVAVAAVGRQSFALIPTMVLLVWLRPSAMVLVQPSFIAGAGERPPSPSPLANRCRPLPPTIPTSTAWLWMATPFIAGTVERPPAPSPSANRCLLLPPAIASSGVWVRHGNTVYRWTGGQEPRRLLLQPTCRPPIAARNDSFVYGLGTDGDTVYRWELVERPPSSSP